MDAGAISNRRGDCNLEIRCNLAHDCYLSRHEVIVNRWAVPGPLGGMASQQTAP
jgi:hypothetical protein